jgi:hypothetical protein
MEVAVHPLVVAAAVTLALLSAPAAAVAAVRLRDLRLARRPLPPGTRLARLALALNLERASTPAQCRLARLRRDLFESGLGARAVVAAHDDPHAAWLLADALRLARRLDDELRALWPAVDAAPERLDRARLRVDAARGLLDHLCEAVRVRAGVDDGEVLDRLVDAVRSERALRLQVARLLEAGAPVTGAAWARR